MLIERVHIEHKHAAGFRGFPHTLKHRCDIFKRRQVVQTVQRTDHGIDGTIEFQFPHVLTNILDRQLLFDFLFHCLPQHALGIVHADHVIATFCHFFCHGAGAACQIQHDFAGRLFVLLHQSVQICRPCRIVDIFRQGIIVKRKCFIARFLHESTSTQNKGTQRMPCPPVFVCLFGRAAHFHQIVCRISRNILTSSLHCDADRRSCRRLLLHWERPAWKPVLSPEPDSSEGELSAACGQCPRG